MYLFLFTLFYMWLVVYAVARSKHSFEKSVSLVLFITLLYLGAQLGLNLREGAHLLMEWFALGLAVVVLVLTLFVVVFMAVKPLRLAIATIFYRSLKNNLPRISATEMTVINAGNTWIEKSILQGTIDWYDLGKIAFTELTPEEQGFLDNEVVELCGLVSMEQTRKDKDLSAKAWQYIKDKGFLGMVLPKKFGGLEFSATAHSAVVAKLSTCSQPLAVSVMVPNSLGPGELLIHYGTEDQKNHYLPRLAKGDEIPCFALTSSSAGSDAGSIEDHGVVCYGEYKGKKELGLRLNWEKRYITLAPVATLLGLAFKAYDPDNLLPNSHPLKGKVRLGITLAIIPTDTPGVTIGNRHNPMNVYFQNGPNQGKDVFIPMSLIIGGIDRIGQGWRMLTECLSIGRGISLPSLSVAGCKFALATTTAYGTVREQFNLPIARFEAIADRICSMAENTFSSEAAQRLTSTSIDSGVVPSVVTAMVKYKNTEMLRQSINDAFDIHGGRAVMAGPRNYLEEIYRSIPISITVEGANILTQSLIVFGQGILRCHPYLLNEVKAINNPKSSEAVQELEKVLFPHFGYVFGNFCASLAYGFSFGRLAPGIGKGVLRRMTQAVSTTSSLLSLTSDLSLLLYGGSLKRKEIASAKFATVWTNLYYAIACIRQYQSMNEPKNLEKLLRITVLNLVYEARKNLKDIISDFPFIPGRFFAGILLLGDKPFGHITNKERVAVSELFCSNIGPRKEFTNNIFRTTDESFPLTRLEKAFVAVSDDQYRILIKQLKALPSDAPIRKGGQSLVDWLDELIAAEHITKAQRDLYMSTKKLVHDAVIVDQFDPKKFEPMDMPSPY